MTKSGSPQVIDITIIGKPTPAGIAFVAYTLSRQGLAQYKQGGFTLLKPTLTGPSERSTQPDTAVSWAASPAPVSGGAPARDDAPRRRRRPPGGRGPAGPGRPRAWPP